MIMIKHLQINEISALDNPYGVYMPLNISVIHLIKLITAVFVHVIMTREFKKKRIFFIEISSSQLVWFLFNGISNFVGYLM